MPTLELCLLVGYCKEKNSKGRLERQKQSRALGKRLGHYNANGERYGTLKRVRTYLESRLRLFGLDAAWYEEIEKVCSICGSSSPGAKSKNWCFDHDHSCCENGCPKCFRSLLCHCCNKGLGHFKDSEAIIEKAANYLRSWRNKR